MGMKMSALDMPNAIMSASVPLNWGVHQPRIRRNMATPAAPRGTSPYSTRERERRPTTSAPSPIPTEIKAEGTVAKASERPSTAFAYTNTFWTTRLAMVQKKTAPVMARRSSRSACNADKAPRKVSNNPPASRAGATGGTAQAAANPPRASRVSAKGASQGCVPAPASKKPPAVVPVRIARKVNSSRMLLPRASCSCGSSSGRTPYLAGLKIALWTPMQASTTSVQSPPVGFARSARVAAAMSSTSTAFIVMMTVRLLIRSAKNPATNDVRTSGRVNTTMARVVWV